MKAIMRDVEENSKQNLVCYPSYMRNASYVSLGTTHPSIGAMGPKIWPNCEFQQNNMKCGM